MTLACNSRSWTVGSKTLQQGPDGEPQFLTFENGELGITPGNSVNLRGCQVTDAFGVELGHLLPIN